MAFFYVHQVQQDLPRHDKAWPGQTCGAFRICFCNFLSFQGKECPIDKQHVFFVVFQKKTWCVFLREPCPVSKTRVGIGGRFFQFGMLKLWAISWEYQPLSPKATWDARNEGEKSMGFSWTTFGDPYYGPLLFMMDKKGYKKGNIDISFKILLYIETECITLQMYLDGGWKYFYFHPNLEKKNSSLTSIFYNGVGSTTN